MRSALTPLHLQVVTAASPALVCSLHGCQKVRKYLFPLPLRVIPRETNWHWRTSGSEQARHLPSLHEVLVAGMVLATRQLGE